MKWACYNWAVTGYCLCWFMAALLGKLGDGLFARLWPLFCLTGSLFLAIHLTRKVTRAQKQVLQANADLIGALQERKRWER